MKMWYLFPRLYEDLVDALVAIKGANLLYGTWKGLRFPFSLQQIFQISNKISLFGLFAS